MTLYFWLVVFSFCRNMDILTSEIPPNPLIMNPHQSDMIYASEQQALTNRADYYQHRKQRLEATESMGFGRLPPLPGSPLRATPHPQTTPSTATTTSSPTMASAVRVQTNPFIDE